MEKQNKRKVLKKNIIKGKRLDELIRIKYKNLPERNQRSAFINDLQFNGSNVDKGMISMYINGKKNISPTNIELFSDILDADAGYLSGDDDLVCNSYAEYLNMKSISTMKNSDKYFHLFRYTGLMLGADNGTIIVDGSIPLKVDDGHYMLTKKEDQRRITKFFTPDEMEKYYQDTMKYIVDYFDSFESASGLSADTILKDKELQEFLNRLKGGDVND